MFEPILDLYAAGTLTAGFLVWVTYDPRGYFSNVSRWQQAAFAALAWPLIVAYLVGVVAWGWVFDRG